MKCVAISWFHVQNGQYFLFFCLDLWHSYYFQLTLSCSGSCREQLTLLLTLIVVFPVIQLITTSSKLMSSHLYLQGFRDLEHRVVKHLCSVTFWCLNSLVGWFTWPMAAYMMRETATLTTYNLESWKCQVTLTLFTMVKLKRVMNFSRDFVHFNASAHLSTCCCFSTKTSVAQCCFEGSPSLHAGLCATHADWNGFSRRKQL